MWVRREPGISVSILTVWTTRVRFPSGQGFSLCHKVQTSSGAHPAVDTEIISSGIKRPRLEADHSLPSKAEVKNTWIYISTTQYVWMAWCF